MSLLVLCVILTPGSLKLGLNHVNPDELDFLQILNINTPTIISEKWDFYPNKLGVFKPRNFFNPKIEIV